ncbi:hypothetical protein F4814DRAFT_461319 [Daldinia grandis]|nr:hypothetical protein F4814DRAFT_461319 [Daldinia grandis]
MAQQGSTFSSITTILKGDCQKAHRANSVLHVLISITSTLILASSQFFMQILSSPSRLEVNRAHLQLRSLEIGVSSMNNIRFISRYKAIGWAVLLISSTPIHLLFSSSIFEIHFQNSDWRLTVASSSFSTQQVAFFPPGASLTNAGAESIAWDSSTTGDPTCRYIRGYGEHVALEDYWDKQSPVYDNITRTARESAFWHNITSHDCREYYASCRPKNKYRDVVIVVDTKADNPEGWTRSQVFSDPSTILGPIWNPHIPRDDLNSLWYSTQCTTNLPTAIVFPYPSDLTTGVCISTCGHALGLKSTTMPTNELASSGSDWIINLHRPSPCSTPNEKRFGYNDSFNSFPVRYCLVEPSPTFTCQVGLSNALLLVTTSCVFLKALICLLVVIYLPHASLVTLGDALESFVSDPDPVTIGLGTFNIYDSHRIQFEQLTAAETENNATNFSDTVQPRLWRRSANRLISVVPRSAWSGYLIDYYNADSWTPSNNWGMPEGAIILLGFWPLGILITLIAGLILAGLPIIYGLSRLPGDMVCGACDSLVLSASCHPHVSSSIPDQDSLYIGEDPSNEDEVTSQATEQELLRNLSRGKLRWGAARMPSKLSTTIDPERNAMHLSFTSEDEYISEPIDDSLYV